MKKNNTFRRAAALVAALSITVSLAAPAFAGTYYIDDGDITIIKNENGSQTIKQQGKEDCTDQVGDETIITTHKKAITTLESDLEGPAAEDSGFGPVVEDNYQPAQPESTEEPEGTDQPEDAEKPEGTDQPEDAEEPKSADQPENTDRQEDADQPESAEEPEGADQQESAGQQPQPQQAAPAAAAPAAPTSVITLINNFANTVLNLTLRDVKIDVSDTGRENHAGKAALSVQGKGNVEIELDGKNELKSGYYRAGLEKTSAGTLTLKDNKEAGSGSLNAEGGALSAGIGGSYNDYSANNGTKNIIITGSTVTATGGDGGAGIGGGNGGAAENITITGSTVTATGGGSVLGFGGAGIGGGGDGRNSDSNGKNITITGSTVTAKGGNGSAGIGGGVAGIGEAITITGSTVTATGGIGAAGIGGGCGGYNGNGENITITGSRVTATGNSGGAGIGGGERCDGENITITGGTVTAGGGDRGAGIGGGINGSGEDITINGGTVTADGGVNAAGIGGGERGNGEDITITDGTVNAAGGGSGAGIGGGWKGSGSNVTVSGAAQVTAIAGKPDWGGAGATIGSGGSQTPDGPVDGKEIQADISHLTTGYIHHIIYDPALVSEDNPLGIVREWWEPERPQPNPENPQPNPEDPNAPAEESNEVSLGTPGLHVETLEGSLLPFDARQQGSTLRVTSNNLAARLHGTRQALEALREQGVEQIQFVTSFKTTTLPVADLLAEGGSWFALEHNGLGSRQLSAAQAESLKCRMR